MLYPTLPPQPRVKEWLTIAWQNSFPGHLGVARVRPRGSGRCAFTRSLFVYSASRGDRERACKDAPGPGGYIKLWVRARWVPGASLSMEIAKRTENGSGQCVHLCRPPPAPDLPMQHRGADSGYNALAPPRAYPAPSLPPAPSRLLPSDLPAPHPPCPGSAAVRSPGSRFASSLRVLCSPPRRSAVFWRPWIDDGGEKEQEAPHNAVEAVSEPRVAGRASQGLRWSTRAGYAGPQGDARLACPWRITAPAGGPTGGLVCAVRWVRPPLPGREDRAGREASEPPGSHSLPTGGTLGRPGLQFFRKGWVITAIRFLTPPQMPDGPGITDASGKLSQYRHPVRWVTGLIEGLQQVQGRVSHSPAQQLIPKFFSLGKIYLQDLSS